MLSAIFGIFESFSTFMVNGIYKNPPFSISNKISFMRHKYAKLAAVVAIHLGLLFQILRIFKPRNTREMYSIYIVCFWILMMTVSIVVVNPYDEDSIEYMLSKEDIEKLKKMANDNAIEKEIFKEIKNDINTEIKNDINTEIIDPAEPKTIEMKKEEETSFVTKVLIGVMLVFFLGLKIYTFLFPLGSV